jgi:hypothetical protein
MIRQDFPDILYADKQAKNRALEEEIRRVHQTGRPILVGTASVEGMPDPGETPVVAFARLFAVRKALSNPVVLVQLAPTLTPLDINGASAQTEAAVVTSFRTKELPALTLPQGPSAAMSQREELAAEAAPGWPPLEIR